PMSPRVATDGTDFFVAWIDNTSPWPSDIHGVRVSHAGAVLDAAPITVASQGQGTFHLDVTFDPAAHDWVVVYNRQTTLDDNDLYAARVSATGEAIEPAGSPVRAAAGAQDFPAVAAGPARPGGVRA